LKGVLSEAHSQVDSFIAKTKAPIIPNEQHRSFLKEMRTIVKDISSYEPFDSPGGFKGPKRSADYSSPTKYGMSSEYRSNSKTRLQSSPYKNI
jgi:hypothetical protein